MTPIRSRTARRVWSTSVVARSTIDWLIAVWNWTP